MSGEAVPETGHDGRKNGADEPVVRVSRITRDFGDVSVLEEMSLEAGEGQLFGLVGPSGCGKTTLVRLIVGLLVPTTGEVTVRGVEPRHFSAADRLRIGYLPQEFSLHPTLTVGENARFIAGLYGLGWRQRRARIREVLEFLEIWDARKRLARDVSGGMKRRLGLAAALFHRPSLLVVDEPTAGLDPALRARIWNYLGEIRKAGTTIFLTTQYIEEVERCDAVGVMHSGRILATGSPDELRRQVRIADRLEVDVEGLDDADMRWIWTLSGTREVGRIGEERLRVLTEDAGLAAPEITQEFERRGKRVRSLDTDRPAFEEVFLRLVARGDDERAREAEAAGTP